jgi:hypothetical protein
MGKKEIGKGFDNMFNPTTISNEKKESKNKKEKLFCEISSDVKTKLQLYRIKNKVTLGDAVEMALQEFLKNEE